MIELVPDPLVRRAIRVNCARRLARERRGGRSRQETFLEELRASAIADQVVDKPNEQYYEVPAEFFELVLGPRLKYSCCHWPEGVDSLAAAEEAMLALTCERAEIENGMEVLDLGCGWGSLTFWLAERYPTSDPRCLELAHARAFIESQARERGLRTIEVVTADANVFDLERRFDRVVSVEMLENARNYEALLDKIAGWLEPGGKLFVHVFSHRELAYAYESGWMAKHFFTAGTMPSHDFAGHLALEEQWAVSGLHYARTAEAWLERLDEIRGAALDILSRAHGADADRRLRMWRIFFMACAELWGYRSGSEWGVSHYRFSKP